MDRSFISQPINPAGDKVYLYYADLKNRVKYFNSLPENKDARISIKLTGSSKPHAYYAIFRSGILEERFLIYANQQWGITGSFRSDLEYDYYNAWGTWASKVLGRSI